MPVVSTPLNSLGACYSSLPAFPAADLVAAGLVFLEGSKVLLSCWPRETPVLVMLSTVQSREEELKQGASDN